MSCSLSIRSISLCISDCSRHADAELLHAKLQCGSTHAQKCCDSIWACNFPDCFLEGGDDLLPFLVLENRPQIPVAAIGDWPWLSMSAHFLLQLDAKVKFLDRQFENRSDRDDHSPFITFCNPRTLLGQGYRTNAAIVSEGMVSIRLFMLRLN